jgi:hypothetical protein
MSLKELLQRTPNPLAWRLIGLACREESGSHAGDGDAE